MHDVTENTKTIRDNLLTATPLLLSFGVSSVVISMSPSFCSAFKTSAVVGADDVTVSVGTFSEATIKICEVVSTVTAGAVVSATILEEVVDSVDPSTTVAIDDGKVDSVVTSVTASEAFSPELSFKALLKRYPPAAPPSAPKANPPMPAPNAEGPESWLGGG